MIVVNDFGGIHIYKGVEKMFLDVTWLENPKIFISSTLDKNTDVIRKEMSEVLTKRGYEVVAFETNSFPYANDHSSNVIEETVNAVAKANLFVLIIDENIGTIVDGESVIEKEYNRAKELRLPIYVFIQTDVWRNYRDKHIGDQYQIKTKEHYEFIKKVSEFKIAEYSLPKDCIEHLNGQLLNFLGGSLKFSTKAGWLWNENYTRSVEKRANEVWIITPDFMWDYIDVQFRTIVVDNVTKRGCIYKYIFLANDVNITKKNEMFRHYAKVFTQDGKDIKDLEKQVQFLAVKADKFYWSSEQIIFNPFALNERAILVDAMDVRDRTLKFNIEFGLSKRVAFREQFIKFWNSNMKATDKKIDISKY